MHHLIYSFCTILLCANFSVLQAQREVKEQWPNGQLKAKGQLNADNKKVGRWEYYYENGNKEAEGSYNGRGISKTIEVCKKSKRSALEEDYSAREGQWTFFYGSGDKKATVSYQGGCPSGRMQRWHKNGKKAEEVEYVDCRPIGARTLWDKEGRKYFETQLLGEGKTMDVEWYANGQMKSQIPYRNGDQYGRVKRWYANGQKEEDVMMKETRVHGSYRSWYPNGSPQRQFFSINNVMSGEYKEWSESGQLVREIVEMQDEKAILVKSYWDNGQLKYQGKSNMPASLSIHRWSQTRHGSWIYWDKQGNVMKTEYYDNGRLRTTEMP